MAPFVLSLVLLIVSRFVIHVVIGIVIQIVTRIGFHVVISVNIRSVHLTMTMHLKQMLLKYYLISLHNG